MNRFAGALILIIAMSSAAFASYDEAVKLFQEKKYQESLKILAAELVVSDDFKEGAPNYKLRYLAAHNHWKLGNERSVIAHFKRCMEINKTSVNPYVDLALYLMEQKRYKDVYAIVKDGMKIKSDAMFYWILGRSYLDQGVFWKAKTFLEKANSINPEFFVSYNDLGVVLMKLKKYGDANAAFSVALAINPDSSEVNNNMALSLYMMNKIDEAKKFSKRASEINPESLEIKEVLKKINSINK